MGLSCFVWEEEGAAWCGETSMAFKGLGPSETYGDIVMTAQSLL